MKKRVNCWEFFKCNEKECPAYKVQNVTCWLVPGTLCRKEIQGKFLEKIEMCLECEPFKANIDLNSMEETLSAVHQQFTEFKKMVEDRDRELEGISLELAVSLSEFDFLLAAYSMGCMPYDSKNFRHAHTYLIRALILPRLSVRYASA